ncbi:MAG: peptide chain release factor N(5)-glutamine methyltransferase [Gammaproteobacteria bacterium]
MTPARDALATLRRRFAAVSASPALDAELLLAHVLGTSRIALAADPARGLSPAAAAALEALASRRERGEPVAYLTGRREFWSLDLLVTPDVLVPRPESELLVARALAAIAGRAAPAVLDLGTGSGAIALAIAHARPDAAVTAVDASEAALRIAAQNAARIGVANLSLHCGSWYAPVAGSRFDLVVANPPYVAERDPALAALAAEPRMALVAGPTGLEALAAICGAAPAGLAGGGALVLEHGSGQGAAVRGAMAGAGLEAVATHRDLAGHERVTEGRNPAGTLQSAAGPGE